MTIKTKVSDNYDCQDGGKQANGVITESTKQMCYFLS